MINIFFTYAQKFRISHLIDKVQIHIYVYYMWYISENEWSKCLGVSKPSVTRIECMTRPTIQCTGSGFKEITKQKAIG